MALRTAADSNIPNPVEITRMAFARRVCFILYLVIYISLITAASGCSTKAPNPASLASRNNLSSSDGLVISPKLIDFGALSPGQSSRVDLRISNSSTISRTLDRIETSCPCIRISRLPAEIPVRETRVLEVSFDPSEEPDFRGSLVIDLHGFDPEGVEMFQAKIHLAVDGPIPSQAKNDSGQMQDASGSK